MKADEQWQLEKKQQQKHRLHRIYVYTTLAPGSAAVHKLTSYSVCARISSSPVHQKGKYVNQGPILKWSKMITHQQDQHWNARATELKSDGHDQDKSS